jgi:hypothetical protein
MGFAISCDWWTGSSSIFEVTLQCIRTKLDYRATLLLQLVKNNMMVVDYFFPSDAEGKKWQMVSQAANKQNDKMTNGVILRAQDEHENTS